MYREIIYEWLLKGKEWKKNDETPKPLSWLAIFKNFFTDLRNASVDKPKRLTCSL